jgi:hypothetical protein
MNRGSRISLVAGPFVAILCIASILARDVQAQDSGLPFLEIGVNAEAAGMGDVHVTANSTAFASFWNPAGLAGQAGSSASLAHHIWIADDRSYALATRIGRGTTGGIGLFVLANTIDDIEQRDVPGPATGSFSAQYLTSGIGYGRVIGPVRVGLNAKYISERILEVSARGYALDAGFQADLLQDQVIIGAAVTNLGSINELSTVETTLPTTLRGGVTIFPFRMIMEDNTRMVNSLLTVEVSYNEPSASTRFHIGAGAEVVEMVTLRAGYITNDELRGFSAGLGLSINEFQFDYAMVPFENGFGGPGHIMSLTYFW